MMTFRGSKAVFCPPQVPTHTTNWMKQTTIAKNHICSWVLCYIFTTQKQFSNGLWDHIPIAESPVAYHTTFYLSYGAAIHFFLRHICTTPVVPYWGAKGADSRGCSGWSWLHFQHYLVPLSTESSVKMSSPAYEISPCPLDSFCPNSFA